VHHIRRRARSKSKTQIFKNQKIGNRKTGKIEKRKPENFKSSKRPKRISQIGGCDPAYQKSARLPRSPSAVPIKNIVATTMFGNLSISFTLAVLLNEEIDLQTTEPDASPLV
jgi:hypothetical protein